MSEERQERQERQGRDSEVARTDFAQRRDAEAVPKTQLTQPEPEPAPAPSADLVAFKAELRPLMSTVMGAFRAGHPDLERHLQSLSDLIQND